MMIKQIKRLALILQNDHIFCTNFDALDTSTISLVLSYLVEGFSVLYEI